jgi:hypothetical protein
MTPRGVSSLRGRHEAAEQGDEADEAFAGATAELVRYFSDSLPSER